MSRLLGRYAPAMGLFAALLPGTAAATLAEDQTAPGDRPASGRGGPTQILYVGIGSECDHPGIQGALNVANNGAEIRVTTGTYSSVDVHNEGELAIIGGYTSCTATEPTDRSILDGAGNDTVMDVFAPLNPLELVLENLTLQNGDSTSRGGGLHIEGAGHRVTLRTVYIENNSASDSGAGTGHGGGIRIDSTAGVQVDIRESSLVGSNTAANDGGGIHCNAVTGTPTRVVVGGDSAIQGNTADQGGGIHAANCEVVSAAGGPFQGIYLNEAGFSGGGIYATAGSQIELRGDTPGGDVPGDPTAPANLIGNTSGSFGGGAFLDEAGTTLVSVDGVIADNSASLDGGGVFVDTDATFEMRRANGTDCVSFDSGLSPPPCSRLENNSSDRNGGGAAGSGGTIDISQTFIDGNSAVENGAAILANFTVTRLEGNVFHDHTGPAVIVAENSSDLSLAWSTVAGNSPATGNPVIRASAGNGDNTVLDLYSSIIRQSGNDILAREIDGSGMITVNTADCLITHELASLPENTRSQVADPMFVAPGNDDYHIPTVSPAVDFCDDTNSPTRPDMDAQIRGVDIIPGGFRWDVGADENQGVIFADGFESA